MYVRKCLKEGSEPIKGLEETMPRAYTESGIMPIFNSQGRKLHDNGHQLEYNKGSSLSPGEN